MPDILLIQPPLQDFYITYKRTIPYGLACIAAALTQNGFSVSIFDGLASKRSRPMTCPETLSYLRPYYGQPDHSPFALFHQFKHFGYSFEYIGRMARESEAFLVGVSALFTTYVQCALKTAQVVKQWLPNCQLVMGGHHPTAAPLEIMEHPAVDFVIRGEGEVAMPLLAKALKNRSALETIPGLVFRQADGSVYQSAPALMDDLDAHPFPRLDHIKHAFYKRGPKNSAVIVTSRGCPLKCSYCCTGRNSPLRFRQRSVSSVVTEIETAVRRHDVGFIDFEDENLSLNKQWFMALLRQLIRRFQSHGLEFRAMNGLFPPSLDYEVIEAMRTAGFKTLNLALATTVKEQLRRFERPDVTRAFDRSLKLAESLNMQAVGYIIGGAPFQTAADTLEDLIYLAQRRVLAGLSIFYPAPGSRDYQRIKDLDILPPDYTRMRSSALPLDHTTSRIQAATLLRLTRILNFMKQLIDEGVPLPDPAPLQSGLDNCHDRTTIGVDLLAAFFDDARIRGVLKNGAVYEHVANLDLNRRFIQTMRRVRVRGLKR